VATVRHMPAAMLLQGAQQLTIHVVNDLLILITHIPKVLPRTIQQAANKEYAL
jgi:hypothetical protein